jgi:hypothetical protein
MAIPTTSDADCQKTRLIFIQPQTVSTTLSTVQAVTTASINLGHIKAALAEYCFIGEIIVRYAAGNWTLIEANKITGNRVTQTTSPAGIFLSSVSTDASITGDGTISSPLSVADSQIDHTVMQNIGSNTHSQIDSHISDATIHFTSDSLAATYEKIVKTYETITGAKTLDKNVTLIDATSGSVAVTIPSVSGIIYSIKKISGANASTITNAVDGVANRELFLNESVNVIYNGIGWFFI